MTTLNQDLTLQKGLRLSWWCHLLFPSFCIGTTTWLQKGLRRIHRVAIPENYRIGTTTWLQKGLRRIFCSINKSLKCYRNNDLITEGIETIIWAISGAKTINIGTTTWLQKGLYKNAAVPGLELWIKISTITKCSPYQSRPPLKNAIAMRRSKNRILFVRQILILGIK